MWSNFYVMSSQFKNLLYHLLSESLARFIFDFDYQSIITFHKHLAEIK